MTPFRSEKDTNWEGAYRVPAMIRWPGHIKAGEVSNEIVSGLDWFPTLVAEGGPNEIGKPAKVTMLVDGAKVAEGQVPRTIPATVSIVEGLDVSMDVGSPVDFTYKPPFKFTGSIEKVTYELK